VIYGQDDLAGGAARLASSVGLGSFGKCSNGCNLGREAICRGETGDGLQAGVVGLDQLCVGAVRYLGTSSLRSGAECLLTWAEGAEEGAVAVGRR
jgi:hypothetical protein